MHNASFIEDSCISSGNPSAQPLPWALCLCNKTNQLARWQDAKGTDTPFSSLNTVKLFHELQICSSPCTCEISESLSSMCQNDAISGLFHLPPTDYHILGKLHGLKTQICFAALTGYWWLLKTSDSECYQETHMLPQGMQFALQAFNFQTGLSVAKFFSTTQRISSIIFNWRLKASHNQMTEELGLSDKWKTSNDFRFNHKRTKFCV